MSQDSFYNMLTLEPKIKDTEKHYIISLKIPEFEQQDVQISTHKRKIHLNLSRRYNEKVKDTQNSSTYKTKRSEILTKDFEVPSIVENQEIQRKYENGILSFLIKKA